jgi:large subunit ribosomal protein L25
LTHLDLHEVRLDQPISAQVAVELVGESPGVKEGGVLTQLVREVTVEALPLEMPDRLLLEIGETEIGSTLRVSDLVLPPDVTVLDDPENVLVTVSAPRLAAELEAMEAEAAAAAELEAEEGEEPVEGEPEGEPGDEEAAAEGESPAAEGDDTSESAEG